MAHAFNPGIHELLEPIDSKTWTAIDLSTNQPHVIVVWYSENI